MAECVTRVTVLLLLVASRASGGGAPFFYSGTPAPVVPQFYLYNTQMVAGPVVPEPGRSGPALPCPSEGFFPNPSNCSRFYRCVDYAGTGQYFSRYEFQCPAGQMFLAVGKDTCVPGDCAGGAPAPAPSPTGGGPYDPLATPGTGPVGDDPGSYQPGPAPEPIDTGAPAAGGAYPQPGGSPPTDSSSSGAAGAGDAGVGDAGAGDAGAGDAGAGDAGAGDAGAGDAGAGDAGAGDAGAGAAGAGAAGAGTYPQAGASTSETQPPPPPEYPPPVDPAPPAPAAGAAGGGAYPQAGASTTQPPPEYPPPAAPAPPSPAAGAAGGGAYPQPGGGSDGGCPARYVQDPMYCNIYLRCPDDNNRYVCTAGTVFDQARQMCRLDDQEDVCLGKPMYSPSAFRTDFPQLIEGGPLQFTSGQGIPSFSQGQTFPSFSQGQTFPSFTQGQTFPSLSANQRLVYSANVPTYTDSNGVTQVAAPTVVAPQGTTFYTQPSYVVPNYFVNG